MRRFDSKNDGVRSINTGFGGKRVRHSLHGRCHIDTVTIGGDWVTDSIAADVTDGGNGFGNFPDAVIAGGDSTIPSRIASIVIKG